MFQRAMWNKMKLAAQNKNCMGGGWRSQIECSYDRVSCG
jgi:hypothetical protein